MSILSHAAAARETWQIHPSSHIGRREIAQVPNGDVEHYFGEKAPGIEYERRRATRAVAYDNDGRVAVIVADEGVSLPGKATSHKDKIWSVIMAIQDQVGEAAPGYPNSFAVTIEYMLEGNCHIELRTHWLVWRLQRPVSGEHIRFLFPRDAARLLPRRGDRWAVESYPRRRDANRDRGAL
jgi:hypothetical protein